MANDGSSNTYVALLRGVNVGGKNKLPMNELREMFISAGCENVRTYIQSGNIIFSASAKVAAAVPAKVAAQIAARFGFNPPLVVRTLSQLSEVLLNNPFLKAGADPEKLHVLFLTDRVAAKAAQELDHNRSAGDSFEVFGQEIYLFLPNGAGNTKLTNDYFDRKLATISTGRNWRTVTKLVELMQA